MDGKEDLYGGDGPTLAQEPAPDAKEQKPDQEDAQTYLVNKDIAPGKKVGDELRGRIVAINENDYSCEYSEADQESEPSEQEGISSATPPDASGGGGDSMYG